MSEKPALKPKTPAQRKPRATAKPKAITKKGYATLGVPVPPDGSYADVYAVEGETTLRAKTASGNWFCHDPKEGWLNSKYVPPDIETKAAKPAKANKIFAGPEEYGKLPPPPGGGNPSDIYHWKGNPVWRVQVGDSHYLYRSLPGMETWMKVEGSSSGGPPGEILTLEELIDMGVALPPGGTYKDVYAVEGEKCLRASTVSGDWYCVDPKAGWLNPQYVPPEAKTEVPPEVPEDDRLYAGPREYGKLPPPPNKGKATDIYHWRGDPVWRVQVADNHYIYRSLPGMESWIKVDGDHSGAPKGEILTLEELNDMGVPLPPGGSYKDVYAIEGEHCLRASTVTGDWFCVDPKVGWLSIRFSPGDAQSLKLAVEANILYDRWYPEVERPDWECSVRIQNIRKGERERKDREVIERERERIAVAEENEKRWKEAGLAKAKAISAKARGDAS